MLLVFFQHEETETERTLIAEHIFLVLVWKRH
jgi:hypothetical protein